MSTGYPPGFIPLTQPPATSLLTTNVPAPTSLYVTDDDFLQVVSQTVQFTQPFNVQYKLLRAQDGQISIGSQLFTNPSDGSIQTNRIQLTEGFLLEASIFPVITGSGERGTCFCSLQIGSGSFTNPRCIQVIAQDYITPNYGLSWPGGPVKNSLDVHGQITRAAIGNPAAGFDFDVSIAGASRWKLLSLSGTLTTSAAVANRLVFGRLHAGVTTVGMFCASAVITASQVALVSFVPGGGNSAVVAPNVVVGLPTEVWLSSMNGPLSFGSSTSGLQAGDQWSGLNSVWEMWIES